MKKFSLTGSLYKTLFKYDKNIKYTDLLLNTDNHIYITNDNKLYN